MTPNKAVFVPNIHANTWSKTSFLSKPVRAVTVQLLQSESCPPPLALTPWLANHTNQHSPHYIQFINNGTNQALHMPTSPEAQKLDYAIVFLRDHTEIHGTSLCGCDNKRAEESCKVSAGFGAATAWFWFSRILSTTASETTPEPISGNLQHKEIQNLQTAIPNHPAP